MTPIVAICPSETIARKTIAALMAHGIQRSTISVISSLPLEDIGDCYENGGPFSWLVFAGAVLGGICAYLLVSLTQQNYPIVTGGMPIVPAWTDGIIVYELTMLGAILATLFVLIVTSPLMNFKDPANVVPAENGSIVLEITPPSVEGRDKIAALLHGQ